MNNEVNNESPVTGNSVDSSVQPVNPTNVTSTPTDFNNSVVPPVMDTPVVNPMPTANNGGVAPKAKISILPIVIIAVVVVALIGGVTAKVVTSTPKAVFKGQINNAFKAVNQVIDEYDEFDKKFDLGSNSLLLNGSLKFNTNMKDEDLELLNKMTMAAEFGIDIDSEELYLSGSIKGDKNTLGLKGYYKDQNAYIDASFYDKVVKVESDEIDFDEFKEALNSLNEALKEVDTKKYENIVDTLNDAINKSLDSKSMKKSSGKFEVDGKTVSATKNSLVLDEDTLQKMIETICDELLNDDQFLSDFAKVAEIDKGDVKEALKELKDSAKDLDMEEDLVINIWTKGLLNSCVGFSLEVDEKEYFSFYQDGKKAEFVVNNHSDYDKLKLVALFEEKKEGTEFTVKMNGEKLASGTIRELSDELIDFDISVDDGSDKYKISIYLSKKEDKKSIKGDYKFKIAQNDEYIEVSGDYGFATGNIPSVDTSKAVDIEDVDEEDLMNSLKDLIKEDSALNDVIGSSLDEYEKSLIDLNSYGMHPIYDVNEALDVLKKDKASVLYVGSTYYSSYSNLDAYNMFEALEDAQEDLDFYSHYLNYYSVSEDFKNAVKDINYTCRTSTEGNTTCAEYPAIYLVKDGEVKKAFRGTITKEELTSALKEIGIE